MAGWDEEKWANVGKASRGKKERTLVEKGPDVSPAKPYAEATPTSPCRTTADG